MLEYSVKRHALEKYAGDRVEAAKFVKGFKAQLEKTAALQFANADELNEARFGHDQAKFEFEKDKSGLKGMFQGGVASAVGKGVGGLAMGLGIAGISKAISAIGNASLHTKFLIALEQAISSNSILREAEKAKVAQYAETIFKFAPNVATDANLLSSILANAVHGQGVDPVTVKMIGDLESRYVENSGTGTFSPKTYI